MKRFICALALAALSSCDLLGALTQKPADAGVTMQMQQAPAPNNSVSTTGQSCATTDAGVMAAADAGFTAAQRACMDTYTACMATNCESAYQQCFGPSYKQGTFAGACSTYMNCQKTNKCDPCTGAACNQCQMDMTCTDCFTKTLAQCAIASCITPYTTCYLATINVGGSSGGCAALQTCCSKLTGSNKTDCEQAYNTASGTPFVGEAACGTALQGYKNKCP